MSSATSNNRLPASVARFQPKNASRRGPGSRYDCANSPAASHRPAVAGSITAAMGSKPMRPPRSSQPSSKSPISSGTTSSAGSAAQGASQPAVLRVLRAMRPQAGTRGQNTAASRAGELISPTGKLHSSPRAASTGSWPARRAARHQVAEYDETTPGHPNSRAAMPTSGREDARDLVGTGSVSGAASKTPAAGQGRADRRAPLRGASAPAGDGKPRGRR